MSDNQFTAGHECGFTPYELKQIAFAAAMRVEETATRVFGVKVPR